MRILYTTSLGYKVILQLPRKYVDIFVCIVYIAYEDGSVSIV